MISFDEISEKICTGMNGLSAIHILNNMNINFHTVETNQTLTVFVPVVNGMSEIKISKKDNRVLYLEATHILNQDDL